MGTVTVYAPNPGHTGLTAGVHFRQGVGQVDEDAKRALAYFKRRGYSIGEPVGRDPVNSGGSEEPVGADAPTGPLPAPPKVGAGSGTDAWAAYAASIGVEADGLSRAEVIAAVEAHLNPEGEGE